MTICRECLPGCAAPHPVRPSKIMLPRGWDRRKIVLLTFAFLFVFATNLTPAQVFDLERDHVQMAELHGFWRFHTGDDPDGKLGWSRPGFDDSNWKVLHSDQHVNVQGYPDCSGTAWYRFRVLLPANHPPLALYIPGIGTSYQVFADGHLIGQFGGLPPHERAYLSHSGGSTGQNPLLGQVVSVPTGYEWDAFNGRCSPCMDLVRMGVPVGRTVVSADQYRRCRSIELRKTATVELCVLVSLR